GTPYKTQFNWNGSAWVGSAPVAGGIVGFRIPGMGEDCAVSSCAGTVPWVGSWQFDFENQTFEACYNITFDERCCDLPPGMPTGITLCLTGTAYLEKAPVCTCSCSCQCHAAKPGGGQSLGGGGPVEGVPSAGAAPVQISDGPIRYATGEVVIEADDLASGGFGTAWGHHRSFSSRLNANQDFGNGFNWQVAHVTVHAPA
ncbi:MAG TPA: hypothetical protein VFW87_03770, partial [Pirellulales bacterium]|nr:hypothetical protein [Pirellulales bacterium]